MRKSDHWQKITQGFCNHRCIQEGIYQIGNKRIILLTWLRGRTIQKGKKVTQVILEGDGWVSVWRELCTRKDVLRS